MTLDRDPFFGPLPQKIFENLEVLEDRLGEIYDAYLAKHDEQSRLEAEFSLKSFLRQAWPYLETSPFVGGWHVDAICEHFQAVSLGHIQRLLVTVPPRTTKSISGNICWNAWEWIADPTLRYLFVSYGQFLSHFNAQRCRRLIKAPWYQMRWGDRYELRSDQDAKGYFETDKGGYRISTSVDGFGTGLGGERICLDGSVPIVTDQGEIPIAEIVERQLPVRVLGSSGSWQRVRAHEKNPGRPLLELTTESGESLLCTEDHPVFVCGRGFIPALGVIGLLHGDVFVRILRRKFREGTGSRCAAREALLLAGVLRTRRARREESRMDGRRRPLHLPGLRPDDLQGGRRGREKEILLAGMRDSIPPRAAQEGVLDMRRGVSAPLVSTEVLLAGVRERAASRGDSGHSKWAVSLRREDEPLFGRVSEVAQARSSRTRRLQVRSLWSERPASPSAPPRRLKDESRAIESCHALYPLPPAYPSEGDQRDLDEPVRITAVRRREAPAFVYNLNVEPDHDYYASGVLTHNCADDAHAVDEAESDLERQNTVRTWTDTMATRGNDPRRTRWVVIMQRVHPQDLAASCIDMGDYVHLSLPAEYEAHRKCRVFLRDGDGDEYLFFEDPREREGESIEPVRLPKDYLARMRREQREKYFAQFQQRPAPPESAMFSRDDFPAVALHHVPDDVDWVRYWDFAATKRERGKKPDYTVGSLIGKSRSTGRKYVRDIRRVQMRPAQVKRLVLATAERDGRLVPVRWGRDPGSAGVWVADDLTAALHRFDAKGDIETGDKRHRAEPVSTQSEAGLWAFVRARWNDAAWAELEGFPEGDNDDIVDTFSGAAKYLDEGGKAMPQWTIDHHLATADEAITAFGDASRGHAGAFVPGTRWNLARAIQYDDRSRRDGYALWIGTPPLGDRAATHLFVIRGLALRPNLSPHEVLAEVNRTEREIVGPIRPDRPEVVFTILPPYAARLRDVLSAEHGIDCALSDADARAGLAALRDALRVDAARLHPIFVGEDGLPLRGAPRLIAIVRSESGLREPKDESDLLRLRQAVEHYTTDGRDRSRTRVAEDYPALQALLALAATWFVEGQEKTERELIEERLPEGLRAGRMPSEADPEAWMRARHLYLAEAEGEAAVDADEDAFFGRRKRIS